MLQEKEGWNRGGQDCSSIVADTEGLGLTPKHGESWVPSSALHKSKGASEVPGRPQMHREFEANLGHTRTCLKL